MLLYEKYSPSSLSGLIGNRLSIEKVRKFGAAVKEGKKQKPIMVYGPSGTGKTAALAALAGEQRFALSELTASDYRDADTLRKRLLPAVKSKGLFASTTLFLFDEVDELSRTFDKGAENVIVTIIRESKQPIAFTANNYWDQRISFLRPYVEPVEFKKVDASEIATYLKGVAAKEGRPLEEGVLKEIAYRSGGDVRSALNDLELVLLGGNDIIDNIGIRDKKRELFKVLDKIFMSNSLSEARVYADNSDVDTGMLIKWVDENIPNRYYTPGSLRDAYQELSFASMFMENAERARHYGYMKYVLVSIAGVSLTSGGHAKFIGAYTFPSVIKYLSGTKQTRGVQRVIATKLAPILHTNTHDIIYSYLPLFRSLLGKSAAQNSAVMTVLEDSAKLDKDELKYMVS